MTAHLLLVTLGPVQDFIAQARRTRDLWYGSHLLSELSRAAARALVDGGAKLIFPSLDSRDAQLVACLAPLRADNTPPQNIANKLLAEVPEGTDPQQLAKAARKAVADHWRNEVAAPVRTKCAGLLAQNIDAVWNEQIDSFLEFAASWLPLGDYAETRRQLEQAIARRKLLRDFDAWTQGRGNVPKSSLDGARESVLLPPGQRASDKARRYRITDGEPPLGPSRHTVRRSSDYDALQISGLSGLRTGRPSAAAGTRERGKARPPLQTSLTVRRRVRASRTFTACGAPP